jgi:hypothetical protein
MNILPTAAASFLIISAAVGAIISPPSGYYQRQQLRNAYCRSQRPGLSPPYAA